MTVFFFFFFLIKFALVWLLGRGWIMRAKIEAGIGVTVVGALEMRWLTLWAGPRRRGSGQRAQPKGLDDGFAVRPEKKRTPGRLLSLGFGQPRRG